MPDLDAGVLLQGRHEGARPAADRRARGDPERLRAPGRRGDGGADRLPAGGAGARPRRARRLHAAAAAAAGRLDRIPRAGGAPGPPPAERVAAMTGSVFAVTALEVDTSSFLVIVATAALAAT